MQTDATSPTTTFASCCKWIGRPWSVFSELCPAFGGLSRFIGTFAPRDALLCAPQQKSKTHGGELASLTSSRIQWQCVTLSVSMQPWQLEPDCTLHQRWYIYIRRPGSNAIVLKCYPLQIQYVVGNPFAPSVLRFFIKTLGLPFLDQGWNCVAQNDDK